MVETKEGINLKLSGMTCANCALKIENKLSNLEGVKNAVVNFANEEATVEYDPNTTNYNLPLTFYLLLNMVFLCISYFPQHKHNYIFVVCFE